MFTLKKTLAVALLAGTSMFVSGLAYAQAAPAPAPYPDSVKNLIGATKKQIKTVNLQEFRALVDQGKAGLIVDVRQEDEYEDGFVPGAVNVPRGLIEFRIWKHAGWPNALDLSKQMTLYCLSGARCALATKSLQDLGFTNVTSVDMRFADWEKGGNPVTKPTK